MCLCSTEALHFTKYFLECFDLWFYHLRFLAFLFLTQATVSQRNVGGNRCILTPFIRTQSTNRQQRIYGIAQSIQWNEMKWNACWIARLDDTSLDVCLNVMLAHPISHTHTHKHTKVSNLTASSKTLLRHSIKRNEEKILINQIY